MTNPTWITFYLRQLSTGDFTEALSNSSKATTELVICARREGHVLKVINLGAGAQSIIKADNVCPHCKGLGRVHP